MHQSTGAPMRWSLRARPFGDGGHDGGGVRLQYLYELAPFALGFWVAELYAGAQ